MKSNSTYNHKVLTTTMELDKLANVRAATKKRRAERPDLELSSQYSFNGNKVEEYEKPEYKLNSYFTALNASILWANHKQWEIDINYQIRLLEKRLDRSLAAKFPELVLFIAEYSKGLLEIDANWPYPYWAETLLDENYLSRKTAMTEFKKEGIKSLKGIIDV